jgi:hypothetical protein
MNKSYLEFLCDSLCNLSPGSHWRLDGREYSGIVWLEKPVWEGGQKKPTKAEVEAEIERLQAEYNTKEYQRQRAPEYPPITDQLDALFHAGVFPPEMAEQIQAIKDKYPKPE